MPPPGPVDDDRVDIDFEHPDIGQVRGNIDDMSPQEAFAVGFAMGQSGDFDEMLGAREDAWAGGENLEDPLDHVRFETGESNIGPHVRVSPCAMRENTMKITRKQLRQIILSEIKKTQVFDIYPKVRREKWGGTWGGPSEERMGRLRIDEPTTAQDVWTQITRRGGMGIIGKIAPIYDVDDDGNVDWNELEKLVSDLLSGEKIKTS